MKKKRKVSQIKLASQGLNFVKNLTAPIKKRAVIMILSNILPKSGRLFGYQKVLKDVSECVPQFRAAKSSVMEKNMYPS